MWRFHDLYLAGHFIPPLYGHEPVTDCGKMLVTLAHALVPCLAQAAEFFRDSLFGR